MTGKQEQATLPREPLIFQLPTLLSLLIGVCFGIGVGPHLTASRLHNPLLFVLIVSLAGNLPQSVVPAWQQCVRRIIAYLTGLALGFWLVSSGAFGL